MEAFTIKLVELPKELMVYYLSSVEYNQLLIQVPFHLHVNMLHTVLARPRTRAPIWHPDVCKIARHRSERLQMSI